MCKNNNTLIWSLPLVILYALVLQKQYYYFYLRCVAVTHLPPKSHWSRQIYIENNNNNYIHVMCQGTMYAVWYVYCASTLSGSQQKPSWMFSVQEPNLSKITVQNRPLCSWYANGVCFNFETASCAISHLVYTGIALDCTRSIVHTQTISTFAGFIACSESYI